jgi:hypothetical protein
MDTLNWNELDRIPIPEGLEERLEAKIDEWEKEEEQRTKRRSLMPKVLRYTAIAASIAVVFGVGYHFIDSGEPVNLGQQDTYQDPILAQQEAERALNLLAVNLNKGMTQMEKARAISERTEITLNKQLSVLQ